jgi:hypothetical protein
VVVAEGAAASADVIALASRAAVGALLGAAASLVAALVMYQFNAAVVLEMDRDAPTIVTGLYGPERVGEETYAWSRQEARLDLPGLDRSRPWTCAVVVKGGRQDEATLPEVVLTVDGVILGRHVTTNEYQSFSVDVPGQTQPGAVIGMHITNTFQPSGGDTRALGVMVDRWTCTPEAGGVAGLPARASRVVLVTGAAFGAAFVVLGATWSALVGGVLLLGAGLAVLVTFGPGPFSTGLDRGMWVGVTIALALTAAGAAWRWGRLDWSASARFALAWTAGAVLLKILGLLHPLKGIVDAVFHAHRVMWVLDGRYLFTQTMPSGVEFPYAIGLYVFTAPWTILTTDFVTLLRIIVVVVEASGGLLLYALVAHWWRDRQAGAVAAVLFSVVPLPFVIIGNANMTNVFAQGLALATVAAAIRWRLQPRDFAAVAGFVAITTAALLSHISTLTLLAATLGLLAIAYWWRGDREIRTSATVIVAASAVAAVVAVLTYYRHFMDSFKGALAVRAAGGASSGDASVSLFDRVAEAGGLVVHGLGWPLLLLAVVGAVVFWRRPWRDRLDLGVLAWIATAIVCIGMVVVTPVERPFLRYAAEFISRVIFTTTPAAILLAALAVMTMWRRGGLWQVLGGAGVIAAVAAGTSRWLDWLR